MVIRILSSFKGESRWSIEQFDIANLLKMNEYLDMQDYISDVKNINDKIDQNRKTKP